MNGYSYTALGDSITNGFAAYACNGFAFNLCKFLKCKYAFKCCKNLGIPGLTSRGLLQNLNSSSEMRHAVKNSSIITISIGGNNIRKCTSDNYNHINKNIADKELFKFKQDWITILECIRNDIGSSAKIYVMTLFNPYSYNDCNYELADFYIQQLNNIISDPYLLSSYGYSVVDVYSYFKMNNSEYWTFFNYPFNSIARSPHPTEEGHYQITKAFINSIQNS